MGQEKQLFDYVGSLNPAIAQRWGIEEHANKPIVIYQDRKQHIIDKHLKDFGSEERIDYIWSKLHTIIKKPDEVFYNKDTNGLEYYKKIGDDIIVAVRLSFGTSLKIRSFYPANKNKLKNRQIKEQQMLEDGEIENILF